MPSICSVRHSQALVYRIGEFDSYADDDRPVSVLCYFCLPTPDQYCEMLLEWWQCSVGVVSSVCLTVSKGKRFQVYFTFPLYFCACQSVEKKAEVWFCSSLLNFQLFYSSLIPVARGEVHSSTCILMCTITSVHVAREWGVVIKLCQ